MTAGLGFAYVFAMIIAGFAGCLVIRNTIAMTQNVKLRYFAYYSFIVGIITLALNFACKGKIFTRRSGGEPRMAASKSKNTGHSGRNTKKKTAMEQEVGRFQTESYYL